MAGEVPPVIWGNAAKTLRALAISFLLPPLTLVAIAHAWPGFFASSWFLPLGLLVLLVIAGMAAVWTAPWPDSVRLGIGAIYLLLAIPCAPILALLAVCSTGDCL